MFHQSGRMCMALNRLYPHIDKSGKKNSTAFFGARGWTASISANIFGFTSPLTDENMSWNFNPMAGPWLATHVWDYYDYTRDKKFLKETGYDLIKSSANFAPPDTDR